MTTHIVAQFEVAYTQLLDPQGKLVGPLPEFAQNSETLLDLYRTMVETRTFDKKAIALQRTGKMGTYAPINGQEAISTAIGHALQPADVLVPYYRDYAAQFQRGVKMSDILAYWGGDERGSHFDSNSLAYQSKDLPICVPIASQCLHAAGVAFAFKYRKQARVAVVSIGDGGTSEGDFYEAMNVAGTWNLPVVFMINNNQWAISVSIQKQTAAQTLAQKAIAAGFQGLQVDGNDILSTRQAIGDAIEKARQGRGPTLIEAKTFRLSDHTTADDATRYQPQQAVKSAEPLEPISRFETFLLSENILNATLKKNIYVEANLKVKQAVDEYLSQTPQPLSSLFDYHYATLPDDFIIQRAIAEENVVYD